MLQLVHGSRKVPLAEVHVPTLGADLAQLGCLDGPEARIVQGAGQDERLVVVLLSNQRLDLIR